MICKLTLKAKVPGYVLNHVIGMPILIKPILDSDSSLFSFLKGPKLHTPLVHEIKRAGLFNDRIIDLQIRVGDTLVFYLQQSDT